MVSGISIANKEQFFNFSVNMLQGFVGQAFRSSQKFKSGTMHVLSAFWYLIGQLFDSALQPRTTKNGIKYLFNEKVGHVFAGGNGWLTNCEDTPHSHCAAIARPSNRFQWKKVSIAHASLLALGDEEAFNW